MNKLEEKIGEAVALQERFVAVCRMSSQLFCVVTTPEKIINDMKWGRYEVLAIVRDYGQTVLLNFYIKDGKICEDYPHTPTIPVSGFPSSYTMALFPS